MFDPNFDLSPAVNARRVSDRTIQEMLGLVKGMVCDGVVSEGECASLGRWLNANQPAISTWPGNVLAKRLMSIYEDGVIDANERHQLYELLCDTVGDGGNNAALDLNYSTRLPLDDPAPLVEIPGRTFVLTGKFIYGLRGKCEQAILVRGGRCRETIIKQPLTLVIGTIGSRDWIQSSHGRKIEAAVHHREAGVPIQIIGEDTWMQALGG